MRDNLIVARVILPALILAALALGPTPACALDPDTGGIWVFKCDWGFNVYNLTNYNMKMLSWDVDEHDGCCPGVCGMAPFQIPTISAMRSYTSTIEEGCSTDPESYDGTTVWGFEGSYLSDSAFEIHLHNTTPGDENTDLHHGTWITLNPHGAQSWATPHTWKCGRYATGVQDQMMHNITTLISSKVMVTMFSSNNKNITVVVQQFNEEASGWNDCNVYEGNQLDFVDNDGDSVPSHNS
jgi:hypothetical protein